MRKNKSETDSVYFLKLLLFFLMGAFWVRISNGDGTYLHLPVGLILGLFFAHHEHFQIDRKIEFAVLLLSAMISAYIPIAGFWV